MPKIISPTPLTISIRYSEITGQAECHVSRPVDVLFFVPLLLNIILQYIAAAAQQRGQSAMIIGGADATEKPAETPTEKPAGSCTNFQPCDDRPEICRNCGCHGGNHADFDGPSCTDFNPNAMDPRICRTCGLPRSVNHAD